MGLFDRFRRKVKQTTPDEGLLVEPDSEEAKKAISEKLEMTKNDISPTPKAETPTPKQTADDEWDDVEPEEDPFSDKTDRKSRKLAMREQAAKKAASRKEKPVADPMETTTGFRLIPAEPASFDVDISDSEVNRGGMIIRGGEVLDGILEELETDLLSVDMGHTATQDLVDALRTRIVGSRITTNTTLAAVIEKSLRASLRRLLEAGYWDFDKTIMSLLSEDTPIIIMVVGVNGTGKTTTSAKMAHRLKEEGYSVVLAAADTFRAGAIDQLAAHSERIGVRCITSQRGGDSAAVARDAVDSARAKGDDIVIIDTAGRMQNKTNLMEELRKVHRVTKPHLVLFVADALAGNDAVEQAKVFQSMLRFDGAVLCKMDTDANGGAAMSIAHATGRPIVLAGVGQGYEDLIPFDPEWLLDSIL
ncbi:MAG: signal recognition particle-docking protein FtsY [Euryarchaeota archaeon]|nr:signal recognition particle-docking protein FtsY [Euryarchaeota archaeon]